MEYQQCHVAVPLLLVDTYCNLSLTAYHLPMQHIYITDYQWLFILIGTISVLTNTQNVGTNANRCISQLCIYVLYRLLLAFLRMSAIRFNVLIDRAFPQACYRTLVEYKGCGFHGISVVCGGIFARKNVIGLKKCIYIWFIRLKKCVCLNAIHWKKCNFAIERIWLRYAQKENRNILS